MEYSNEGLKLYLENPEAICGPEDLNCIIFVSENESIRHYINGIGSTRFVFEIDGIPIAFLQVMSSESHEPTIANIYVLPEYRRQGIMTRLYQQAARIWGKYGLHHAPAESVLGQFWLDSLSKVKVIY